jgi:DNA-binding GntR family transcriptional regulator
LARKNPVIEQIKRLPLERQASAAIRDRILSGDFPPGYRLVETMLAEQLGLSRGTVRAALSELVHEGLVEQVAYTRWAVPELSAKDAWELYTLRSALEGLAARLVAERISPPVAERVEQAFEAIRDAAARNHRASLTDADAALHKLIIRLSENTRLERQYTVIEQQIRRYIACSNALIVDPKGIVAQHRPIVEAIVSGRPAAAEREAKHHNIEEGSLLVVELRRSVAAKAVG